jgi:hypothetical protein
MKVGENVAIKQGKGRNAKAIEWTVVSEHDPPLCHDKECADICIAGLDVESLREDEDLAQVFLHLFCKDFRTKTRLMNDEVENTNRWAKSKKNHVKNFTDSEFLIGLALLIVDGAVDGNGGTLWRSVRARRQRKRFQSIVTMADFEDHDMPYWRFKQYHKYVPVIWQDKSKKETDECWKFIAAPYGFNERRKTVVRASGKRKMRACELCVLKNQSLVSYLTFPSC